MFILAYRSTDKNTGTMITNCILIFSQVSLNSLLSHTLTNYTPGEHVMSSSTPWPYLLTTSASQECRAQTAAVSPPIHRLQNHNAGREGLAGRLKFARLVVGPCQSYITDLLAILCFSGFYCALLWAWGSCQYIFTPVLTIPCIRQILAIDRKRGWNWKWWLIQQSPYFYLKRQAWRGRCSMGEVKWDLIFKKSR